MTKKITQLALIMEYFMKHPNRAIKHPEVVDWATKEYQAENWGSLSGSGSSNTQIGTTREANKGRKRCL